MEGFLVGKCFVSFVFFYFFGRFLLYRSRSLRTVSVGFPRLEYLFTVPVACCGDGARTLVCHDEKGPMVSHSHETINIHSSK